METRRLWLWPIDQYGDEVLKLGYIKVLSEAKFESIKIPTNLANYRYQHLISPMYVLFVEVIKTRKNWILKDILDYRQIFKPIEYSDYLKLTELCHVFRSVYQDELETNLLSLVEHLSTVATLKTLDIQYATKQVFQNLGFE